MPVRHWFFLILIIVPGWPSVAVHADEPVVDGKRAFGYLERICQIGPRPSGSTGMAQQQRLIVDHFRQFDAKLYFQEFEGKNYQTGNPVRMVNIIVSWNPSAQKRVLLCCHYDTRPFPDQDPIDPTGRFVGANDGGSGVAVLMELAHHMREIKPTYGVDFVFFDGEELVFKQNSPIDRYFQGSKQFATAYRNRRVGFTYVCGVLLDMVGGKDMKLPIEKNSLRMAPRVTRSVWAAARKANAKSFVPVARYTVQDDHIPLNEIAKIPTCDVIDFKYEHWHTTGDVPDNCSADSLAEVARVMLVWLQEVPKP